MTQPEALRILHQLREELEATGQHKRPIAVSELTERIAALHIAIHATEGAYIKRPRPTKKGDRT